MKIKVRFEGGRELDKALSELPRSLQRGVLTRTLRKAGQPIADMAESLAPRDTGELAGSITVSPKVRNKTGKAEFASVLRAGGSRAEAVSALRAARRAAKIGAATAVMYVGPAQAKTKKNAIKRIVQEFGSVNQPAQPYMRPAWDAKKNEALDLIRTEMWTEIEKTAARAAKRAAKKAAGL